MATRWARARAGMARGMAFGRIHLIALLGVLAVSVWYQLRHRPFMATSLAAGAVGGGHRRLPSQLSQDFIDCMQDVGRNLPIHKTTGELMAHHFLAERWDQWNADKRFDHFDPALSEQPLILYVGGNTRAEDSRRFLERDPQAQIHIYEPVPSYVESLRHEWREIVAQVHTHDVGLGNRSTMLALSKDTLDGQGTYIMDAGAGPSDGGGEGAAAEDQVQVRIVDAKEEMDSHLRSLGGKPVDLMHVNCEGCEWEMLMRLAETDMLRHARVLQISFHNYGERGIGYLLPQYCLIREHLMRTHDKVWAIPFAWERWQLKQAFLR